MPEGLNLNVLITMIDAVKTSLAGHDTAIALLKQEMETQAETIETLKKKVDKLWDKMLICTGGGLVIGYFIHLMVGK